MSAAHAYPSSQVRGSTVQVRLLLGHQPCSEPQAFRADPRGIVRPRVSPHAARGPGLPFAVVCFGGGSPRGQREGRLIATGRGAADRGCVRVPGPLGTETGRGHRRQAQLLSPRLVCVCAWRRGPSGAGRGCGVSLAGSAEQVALGWNLVGPGKVATPLASAPAFSLRVPAKAQTGDH